MSAAQERIKNAEERLARAIGRVQAAAEKIADQPESAVPSDALVDELSRLQTENAQLKGLMGDAQTRLDATIAKLKSQMGEQG
ncbi:hypothetical protein ACFL12_04280 [Pseudomonadota bacterium]